MLIGTREKTNWATHGSVIAGKDISDDRCVSMSEMRSSIDIEDWCGDVERVVVVRKASGIIIFNRLSLEKLGDLVNIRDI